MTQKSVKVYTQPGCGVCKAVKEYLTAKGVEFQELDITVSDDAYDELTDKYRSRGTPTLVVGDEVLIGFDQNKLDAALKD